MHRNAPLGNLLVTSISPREAVLKAPSRYEDQRSTQSTITTTMSVYRVFLSHTVRLRFLAAKESLTEQSASTKIGTQESQPV